MAINIYNIKKWTKMLTHKSVLHVNQDLGKVISLNLGDIRGYYNNLMEKVTMQPHLLGNNNLPVYRTKQGENIFFPIDIFQYGLGAYDLYLTTGSNIYKEKFLQCCEWAIEKQEKTGGWNNFFFIYPQNPYSAMAQGEATSLLLRGYKETQKDTFLKAAQMSIDFMLKPLEEGGVTSYRDNGDIFLYEYTHLPIVLNGWIFAIWGLYDISKATNNKKYQDILVKAEKTLEKHLNKFDCGYWSKYDINKKIASPFYHNLHIAQMQAMYILTQSEIYSLYCNKFNNYQKKGAYKSLAFIQKAYQKIIEK